VQEVSIEQLAVLTARVIQGCPSRLWIPPRKVCIRYVCRVLREGEGGMLGGGMCERGGGVVGGVFGGRIREGEEGWVGGSFRVEALV
jgi:hypothetical protein